MIALIISVAITLYMLGEEDGVWWPFITLAGFFLFMLAKAEFF